MDFWFQNNAGFFFFSAKTNGKSVIQGQTQIVMGQQCKRTRTRHTSDERRFERHDLFVLPTAKFAITQRSF